MLGIAITQVQDLARGLIELHEVHKDAVLKPVKILLDGIPFLKQTNCNTQLGVLCKLAKGALGPFAHVIDEDVKQHWFQYRALKNTSYYCFSLGH